MALTNATALKLRMKSGRMDYLGLESRTMNLTEAANDTGANRLPSPRDKRGVATSGLNLR